MSDGDGRYVFGEGSHFLSEAKALSLVSENYCAVSILRNGLAAETLEPLLFK